MVRRDAGDIVLSSVEIGDVKHEIVIVRRMHSDEGDAHHGGVWKIAFADFMTAMMCFFLVMWLINASNEQIRASVASYFNPVKLIDRNSSRKGLEDIGDGPHFSGNAPESPEVSAEKAGNGGQATAGQNDKLHSAKEQEETAAHSDQNLFADPYAVLAEIATNTDARQNISAKGDGGAEEAGPATGASGGESYRDPFAPDFWSQQMATPTPAEASAERAKAEGEVETTDPAAELTAPSVNAPLAPDAGENAAAALQEKAEPEPASAPPSETAVEAADAIRQELATAFEPGDPLLEGISVTATDEGIVISVTDQLEFGMFEIGSAVPRRELVLAMEKISKAISTQKGALVISGHTDGRPFKSETYDNWRLSTARAHSAYYMLVRGGLDERRVTEVAGYADRKLKEPAEPLAAANRRIEILLKGGE
ncbi:MotB family protein [Mesorhizobium camelthorni]|uniref:MotB family protein n=1 Tax=Allomesorhizobium camelthorni TaxID=475069 RepID=A0A6G4WC51_9HYPH|nr:MotB family protein [Mesorhizobium camelthorni]